MLAGPAHLACGVRGGLDRPRPHELAGAPGQAPSTQTVPLTQPVPPTWPAAPRTGPAHSGRSCPPGPRLPQQAPPTQLPRPLGPAPPRRLGFSIATVHTVPQGTTFNQQPRIRADPGSVGPSS